MPTTSPPILVWTPGGGTPVGPISNPPVYSQAGTTQLVEGQAYIDVVFGSIQTTDDWVFGECMVVNEIDVDPLNIWPGIITDKTTSGFRLQLNGMPDSGNYYLHWAVSGTNIEPVLASTYYLTGPSTGELGAPSTFTVRLPPSTTIPGPITITLSDDGAGGSFDVPSVILTATSASATFNYTPASYAVITISTTNSGTLTDPTGIVFTVYAATYTFSGPSAGSTGVASTNFTVALPVGAPVAGTVTVTPSSGGGGGGGTFTPTTVNLTTGAPSATFTYTPASAGTKTISVTNNGGLTNPGSISYVVTTPFAPTDIAGLKGWWNASTITPPVADGALIAPGSYVADISGTANHAGANIAVIYKSNIINGKPVLRFPVGGGAGNNLSITTPVSGTAWTIFSVMKANAAAASAVASLGVSGVGTPTTPEDNTFGPYYHSSDSLYLGNGTLQGAGAGDKTAFHVYTGSSSPYFYVDGVSKALTPIGGALAVASLNVIARRNNEFSVGDIAEVLIYDSVLGSTDRAAVENYLRTKYGL